MDRLVLDTNQLVEKDWRLRGAAMRLIEKAIELELVSLVVPQIVVDEANNKFRQRLEADVKSMHDATGRVSRLVDSKIQVPTVDIAKQWEKYRSDLDQRLTQLGAKRPGYTAVKHEWLVSKALGSQRPFREKDRGYRDALVWHSVLYDVASTEYQTYLVSENKTDFGDTEGGLHPDLVADLKAIGLDGRVTYVHDLQKFVDETIKPALEKAPTPLTVEAFEELFEKQLDSIIDQLRRAIDKEGLSDLPYELFEGGAYIYQLGLVSAQPTDAYRLDDTSYYTSFDVLVEATFDQTVYAPDAVWLADQLDISGVTHGDSKTTDLDFTLTIPLALEVVTSTEEGEEPEVSVELKEFYGFCPSCRHPILSDSAEHCSGCGRALV